jgi:hypothetical protein
MSRIQTVWLEFLQPVRLFPPQKLGNCLRLLNLLKKLTLISSGTANGNNLGDR